MNKEELNDHQANESTKQGVVNFLEHMEDNTASDISNKLEKIQERAKEELEHIRDWPEPQGELRAIYWSRRMHSLGKKAERKQTAKEVLKKCISDLKPKYPDFKFIYDEDFFNRCG